MSRPMILTFNISGEKLSKLRFLCMKLGLQQKSVSPEDFCQPIGALCGLQDRQPDAAPCDAFSDELLVFCHMSSPQIDRFLTSSRQMRVPSVALKAILTPTNVHWNARQLRDELAGEREAILKGNQAAHHDE